MHSWHGTASYQASTRVDNCPPPPHPARPLHTPSMTAPSQRPTSLPGDTCPSGPTAKVCVYTHFLATGIPSLPSQLSSHRPNSTEAPVRSGVGLHSQAQPKRPTRRSWVTTYSNSKPGPGSVVRTRALGDLWHPRRGGGGGTALPGPRHPPRLALAARPRSVSGRRSAHPGLAAGGPGRAQRAVQPPLPPSPARPARARPETRKGRRRPNPGCQRGAHGGSLRPAPEFVSAGSGPGLQPLAGDRGEQSQRRPQGRPGRSEGTPGTEPDLGSSPRPRRVGLRQ